MKAYPIRWCTGGCASGSHHAHIYDTDPVDGPLDKPHLCPGNLREAREFLDEDEQATGWGFIPESVTSECE